MTLAETSSASPDQPIGDDRVLLVGFTRAELEAALAAFPPAATAGLELVTTGGPIVTGPWQTTLAPGDVEERLADALRWGGRRRPFVARVRARARRALGRLAPGRSDAAGNDRLLRSLTATIQRAVEGGDAAVPPLAIGLAGIDHLAMEPLVRAGRVRAAPGGLRWLADRRIGAAGAPPVDAGPAGPASGGQPGSRDL